MKHVETQGRKRTSGKMMSVRAGIAFLLTVAFFIVATVLPAAAAKCDFPLIESPLTGECVPIGGPGEPGDNPAPIPIPRVEMKIDAIHWANVPGGDGFKFVVVGSGFLPLTPTNIKGTLGGITLVTEPVTSGAMVTFVVPRAELPLEHGTYNFSMTISNTFGPLDKAEIAVTIGPEIKHVTFSDVGGVIRAPNEDLELAGRCGFGMKVIGMSCDSFVFGVNPQEPTLPGSVFLEKKHAELNNAAQGGKCTWTNGRDFSIAVGRHSGWLLCVGTDLTLVTPPPPLQ